MSSTARRRSVNFGDWNGPPTATPTATATATATATSTPTATPTATSTPTPTATPTPTPTLTPTHGQVGGVAWFDANGDGLRTAGEPGLNRVTIRLLKQGRGFDQTLTESDGAYLFPQLLPGSYAVHEVQPGWLRWSTTPNEVPVTVVNGQEAIANFGDWNGRPTWLPLILR